jgi:hypothetical protein
VDAESDDRPRPPHAELQAVARQRSSKRRGRYVARDARKHLASSQHALGQTRHRIPRSVPRDAPRIFPGSMSSHSRPIAGRILTTGCGCGGSHLPRNGSAGGVFSGRRRGLRQRIPKNSEIVKSAVFRSGVRTLARLTRRGTAPRRVPRGGDENAPARRRQPAAKQSRIFWLTNHNRQREESRPAHTAAESRNHEIDLDR